jgi:hypothetical protein
MKNTDLFLKQGSNGMSEQSVWDNTRPIHHQGHNGQPLTTTTFRPETTMEPLKTAHGNPVWRSSEARRATNESTPLAKLVRQRLSEMGIRQSEFCRAHRFDQGLLSKIQNSVITNLSLESVLRLSVGLAVPPQELLALIDRMDLHDLVLQAYNKELSAKTPANS